MNVNFYSAAAAIELARSGIRVNCVAPSYVQTDMYERTKASLTPEQLQTLVDAAQPLGFGTALDGANAISFLVAETGRWREVCSPWTAAMRRNEVDHECIDSGH